jgi:hypothetical protein
MKLMRISGFLPDTATTLEHTSVVRMRELIEDAAKSQGTTISKFDVSNGIAIVGLSDDKAFENLAAQFREETDVKVSEITLFKFEREQNRLAQEKVNKMRATRKAKKE